MTLEQLLQDHEYAEIFQETEEERKLKDSLFNGKFAMAKQSFAESMAILSSGKDPLIK